MRPYIELGQRSFAGRRAWVYGGIALRDRADGRTEQAVPREVSRGAQTSSLEHRITNSEVFE